MGKLCPLRRIDCNSQSNILRTLRSAKILVFYSENVQKKRLFRTQYTFNVLGYVF